VPDAALDDPTHVPRDPPSDESEHQRLNRELDQLLQELRVALPGVQVLLAFLLTVPFADGFDRVEGEARTVFVAAVSLAALASVLLIAPTVHHRLRFREGTKEEMIKTANGLALAGATCLGLAIGCALYVVGDAAFPATPARWIGPAMVAVAAVVWFVLPLRYRSGRTPRPAGHVA
jgi:hypothetical protein